jgi:streptogramin lyase
VAVAVGALVAIVAAACGSHGGNAATANELPLQQGAQTTLRLGAPYTAMGVDGHGALYFGGGGGLATLAPGASTPTSLKLDGYPTVSTMAVTPDGTLYFITLDGVTERLAPGATSTTPVPLPRLAVYGELAVGRDGTLYVGDDRRNEMLALVPGASAPTALPVTGVEQPGHLAVDAAGNLFVVMNGTLAKIAKGSTAVEPVAGAPTHVGGLALDAAGDLYATDVLANTVSRMPIGGGAWVRLPFQGLQSPTAIAVDGDGNVYVVHRGGELVRLAAR